MELEILDVGCRYGLHPSFNAFKECAIFHMFDVDKGEIERLQGKYRGAENIHFYPVGLYSEAKSMSFKHRAHKGLGSLAEVNGDYIRDKRFMNDSFEEVASSEVALERMDSLFAGKQIHFMKLDAEGSELEILRGGEETLKHALGVRIETNFAPLYEGCPFFGDIHAHMIERGFELLNLDYDGKGHALSPYTLPWRYGILIGCDGVWVRRQSSMLGLVGGEREKEIIFYSLFLMTNRASDVVLDTLNRAKEAGMKFEKYSNDPYFILLDSLVQRLFKDMATLPYAACGGRAVFQQSKYIQGFLAKKSRKCTTTTRAYKKNQSMAFGSFEDRGVACA